MYYQRLTAVRLARLRRGYTQLLLARRAGVSATRVSLIECGHVRPQRRERVALARALGVSQEKLFPYRSRLRLGNSGYRGAGTP